jgi:phage terminase small subunit
MAKGNIKLTAKQQRFAEEWFATGNKTEAYRRAYPGSEKWKESAVNVKASLLSRHDKVVERFGELAKASQDRNDTTVDTIDKMLKNAFVIAKKDVKPSAMVGAAMGLAKLHGLEAEAIHRMKSEAGIGDLPPVTNITYIVQDASVADDGS